MTDFELVVVGGGLASARALKAYREAGGEGRAALVSRDDAVPYHRPPLSKAYLRGEREREATQVEPERFYAENDVELLLATAAGRLLPAERRVLLADGRQLRYERLLLATGAWPRRLDVPGGELDPVLTLRTLADSDRIRAAAQPGRRAVVVGGSFIGMEVSASLRGLGVDVALVHRGAGLFDSLGCRELSSDLVDLYRSNDVRLLLGDGVEAVRGNGSVAAVETRSGELLEADLVVAGVGVEPETELASSAGLDVEDGIVVDQGFRTSAPGIWAVGDVAAFPDPIFGRRRRIEHWSNANYQGTEVGKALAGENARYATVSTFFTEVFGLSLRILGDLSGADEVSVRGSFAERNAVALYLRGGRLVGAIAAGQEEWTREQLIDAIRSGRPAPVDLPV